MACVVASLDLGRAPLNGRAVRWVFLLQCSARIQPARTSPVRAACSQHHRILALPRWLGDRSAIGLLSKPSGRRGLRLITLRVLLLLSRTLDLFCRDARRLLTALSDNPNQWGDPDDTGALCLSVSDVLSISFSFPFLWLFGRSAEARHRSLHRRSRSCICSPEQLLHWSGDAGASGR
jgi:hypothetical protein